MCNHDPKVTYKHIPFGMVAQASCSKCGKIGPEAVYRKLFDETRATEAAIELFNAKGK